MSTHDGAGDGSRPGFIRPEEPGESRAGPARAAPADEGAVASLPSRAEMGTFFAFRYPGFRLLWLGNAFGSTAQWIHLTTLGWVVYEITGSGALLGAIIGIGNLGTPFVAPFAGLAADRFKRNRLLAAAQLLLALNAALLALALMLDVVEVWMLFAFSIGASILNGVSMPTRQAMVFDVVPREVGPNAVALSNMAMNVMRTAGPSIGGFLIVFFGPANSFLAQGLAYLCVTLTMLRIRIADPPPGAVRRQSFVRDLSEGYRWVLFSPPARVLLMMLLIYPLFIIPVHTTLVFILASDTFGVDAGGVGILHSALGLGGIVGGLLVATLHRVERRGLMQLYSMLACGGFLALFALAGIPGMFWVGVAMLVLSGVGGAMYNTTNQTLVQLIAPDHLRGRITSVLQVQPLGMAVGIFITGVAADALGPVSVGTANGILAVGVALLIVMASPYMRGLRLSRLIDESDAAAARSRTEGSAARSSQ